MTQQALDDAIARSSQLLLCGQKTFATEADLQPYAVQYFKHAITAKQGWFAIQGVLMASGYYTGESLYDPAIQQADRERVNSSEKQLQLWLQMANAELPTSQQASPARLEVLLKRCGVKVLYMQLYASMCLQPQERLQEIAVTVGASLEELLQRTSGPWLLGELCASAALSHASPIVHHLEAGVICVGRSMPCMRNSPVQHFEYCDPSMHTLVIAFDAETCFLVHLCLLRTTSLKLLYVQRPYLTHFSMYRAMHCYTPMFCSAPQLFKVA